MKSLARNRLSKALAVAFLFLIFSACSEDSWEPMNTPRQTQQEKLQKDQEMLRRLRVSEGVVTGPDFRMCPSPCCGGWIIIIDSTNYTFSDFPQTSTIDPTTQKFPLQVEVVWSLDTMLNCNHINVQWMRVKDSASPVSTFIPVVPVTQVLRPQPSIVH